MSQSRVQFLATSLISVLPLAPVDFVFADEPEDRPMEEIVVTGSRIVRTEIHDRA